MKNDMIDAISNIDGDLLEEYFKTEAKLQKAKVKKRKNAALMRAALAACLVLALCTVLVRQYIPVEYDLDYSYKGIFEVGAGAASPPQYGVQAVGSDNVWVYYVKNGEIRRQRVRLPSNPDNVFLVWKHLNGIGDDMKMIRCEVVRGEAKFADYYEYFELYDGFYKYEKHEYTVINIVISADLAEYSDTLILSLEKSIEESAKIKPDDVNIIFE